MARWKLTEKHYLQVPGTEWEYSEVDRKSGRPKRTKFPVPLYLDPESIDDLRSYGQMDPKKPSQDPEDWLIIVTNIEGQGADVYFTGNPTPGMMPLDEEAKAITEKLSGGAWKPTVDITPEAQNSSYSAQLLSGLADKLAKASVGVEGATAVQGMDKFMETMAKMMEQQTAILATLAANQGHKASPSMTVRK